jgi:hypothetical protein
MNFTTKLTVSPQSLAVHQHVNGRRLQLLIGLNSSLLYDARLVEVDGLYWITKEWRGF